MGKPLIHDDIERFIARSFPPSEQAAALEACRAATVEDGSPAGPRLIRCALVAAAGSLENLRLQLEHLKIDYRDVIVAGEYTFKDGALVKVRDLGASFADDA